MLSKVLVLVTCIYLIQTLNAASTEDLIDELEPRLAEASAKVATVIRNERIKTGIIYTSIEISISLLSRDLGEQKSKIKYSINQAISDDKTSGKNTDSCVDQVNGGLKVWNKISLELCRDPSELDIVGIKLLQIEKLKDILAAAPTRCIIQNRFDLDKIKACVEDFITDVEKKADEAAQDIDNTLESGLVAAKKCADDAVSKLGNQLNKLDSDFSNCIKNA